MQYFWRLLKNTIWPNSDHLPVEVYTDEYGDGPFGRPENLYSYLGVRQTASTEEIRQAYRARAKVLHPDLNPNDQAAADAFKLITDAHNILSDPKRRQKYDEWLERQRKRRNRPKRSASRWPIPKEFVVGTAIGCASLLCALAVLVWLADNQTSDQRTLLAFSGPDKTAISKPTENRTEQTPHAQSSKQAGTKIEQPQPTKSAKEQTQADKKKPDKPVPAEPETTNITTTGVLPSPDLSPQPKSKSLPEKEQPSVPQSKTKVRLVKAPTDNQPIPTLDQIPQRQDHPVKANGKEKDVAIRSEDNPAEATSIVAEYPQENKPVQDVVQKGAAQTTSQVPAKKVTQPPRSRQKPKKPVKVENEKLDTFKRPHPRFPTPVERTGERDKFADEFPLNRRQLAHLKQLGKKHPLAKRHLRKLRKRYRRYVMEIQRELKRLNCYHAAIDGRWGPTSQSVRRLARTVNFPTDLVPNVPTPGLLRILKRQHVPCTRPYRFAPKTTDNIEIDRPSRLDKKTTAKDIEPDIGISIGAGGIGF